MISCYINDLFVCVLHDNLLLFSILFVWTTNIYFGSKTLHRILSKCTEHASMAVLPCVWKRNSWCIQLIFTFCFLERFVCCWFTVGFFSLQEMHLRIHWYTTLPKLRLHSIKSLWWLTNLLQHCYTQSNHW